jgi:hypothetical protein
MENFMLNGLLVAVEDQKGPRPKRDDNVAIKKKS